MHSVRIKLAKLILVDTKIPYEATGDAGMSSHDAAGFMNPSQSAINGVGVSITWGAVSRMGNTVFISGLLDYY